MKTFRCVLSVGFLFCASCAKTESPTQPTESATVASPAPLAPSPTASSSSLPLGQPVEVTLNAKITGQDCEIGNDPVPCVRFAIDAPRSGTLVIQIQFATGQPMFLYMYREISGNVSDLQNVASRQSPLLAQSVVQAGRIYLHAGLNLPWANSGEPVHLQLLATLE